MSVFYIIIAVFAGIAASILAVETVVWAVCEIRDLIQENREEKERAKTWERWRERRKEREAGRKELERLKKFYNEKKLTNKVISSNNDMMQDKENLTSMPNSSKTEIENDKEIER